jgi:hypothetical protein
MESEGGVELADGGATRAPKHFARAAGRKAQPLPTTEEEAEAEGNAGPSRARAAQSVLLVLAVFVGFVLGATYISILI